MKHCRLLLLALLALSLQFRTAAQNTDAAIDLNDRISSITDSLYALGAEWGQQVGVAFEKGEYVSLKPIRIKMEAFIARKQLEVLKMKDIGGSEQLRLAMLGFLFYEADMINENFVPLEKMTGSADSEKVQELIARIQEASAAETERIQLVIQQQHKYAAKNGFRIAAREEN